MSSSNLRHWLSCGDVEKLENVVLDGKGIRLLGEQSSDLRTRVFLKGLPNYLTKIAQIHDAVSRGSLTEVRKLVDSEPKKKLVIAKDPAGTPLIHKAVYYDHQNILEWILNNYPITVDQKDREGRTALHYCAACRDPEAVWDLLIESGCDASVCDRRAKPAAYYLHHSNEIELPDPERMAGRRLRPRNAARSMTLDFKSSNIRIWIHNRDIGKLQHVLWEGHGSRLRCETSNNVRVKRFLDAVPFIMAAIKDIHTAVIKNDVEAFRQRVEDPVSPIILSSKDSNGLNVLHKAAGLGYGVMVKEILSRYPVIINSQDNDGKTPLHYAAICRDGGTMYDLLIVEGADETKVDNRQKMPSYYKNRPSDVDLSCLVMIPDAPRVGGTSFPRNWDWRIIDSDQPLRRPKRSKGHNSNNSNGDDDSAFDSGESTKLTEELATPEIENAEDELNGNEDDENADAEKAEEDDAGEPEDSNQAEDGPEAEASENPGPAEGEEPAAEADDNNNDETEAKPAETETEETGDDPQEEAPKEDEEKNEGESDTTAGEEEKNEEDNEDGKEDEAAENEGEKEENAEGGDADETEENNAQDKEDKKNDGDAEQNEEGEAAKEEETDEGAKEKTEENEEAKTEENEDQPDSGVGVTPNDEEQALIGGEESDPGPEQTAGELDEETAELLASGTMEQLAAIVLSGEGHRLVGRKSTDRDLQAFLNNVPNYMAKIQAVHKAAREGELKDLQTSLDRRKFAIAKDKSSPHGATPLHVAVIFGHTPVVRYLDSRFPETAHALDFDGRTPLHYAATINDNGHYYNLLLNLGANPLVQDNFGHKAAYYKENQEDLSHKRLLRDFGAPEQLADEMLEDKDEKIFEEEEGQYLAKSLGDPLIKGLTEVANARPNNPVTYLATYLYNFANQDESGRDTEGSDVLIITEEKENLEEEPSKETKDEDENNENDDGYPKSPTLEERQSHFADCERDENGQTPVHYAANRTHGKDGLYHMLQGKQLNIAIRDSQYRTARDIAEMSGNYQNVREIDRFVVYLAARGETDKLVELLMEGYDHILDTEDEEKNVVTIAAEEGNKATVQFLQSISNYTESLKALHRSIRLSDLDRLRDLFELRGDGAKLLAMGKNRFGRCTLHTAVLNEQVDMVRHIAQNYPETLRVGDNLGRTALHYATGIPSIEIMSNVLIQAGARRVHKDLKLRQPAYYFMNRSEIRQLQEEEKELRKMETGRMDDDSSE